MLISARKVLWLSLLVFSAHSAIAATDGPNPYLKGIKIINYPIRSKRRVLLSFDFAYGYPVDFAPATRYGVRVSAYGISQQWLRRPRKRLRPGPEHTGRSARSGGSHSAGLRAPRGYVQPAVDVAHFSACTIAR
jgi:hypothetical protein